MDKFMKVNIEYFTGELPYREEPGGNEIALRHKRRRFRRMNILSPEITE